MCLDAILGISRRLFREKNNRDLDSNNEAEGHEDMGKLLVVKYIDMTQLFSPTK